MTQQQGDAMPCIVTRNASAALAVLPNRMHRYVSSRHTSANKFQRLPHLGGGQEVLRLQRISQLGDDRVPKADGVQQLGVALQDDAAIHNLVVVHPLLLQLRAREGETGGTRPIIGQRRRRRRQRLASCMKAA